MSSIHPHSEEVKDVPVDAVQADDLLLVRPGEMIPADALVVKGK